jgi:hypothetical protein
MKPGGKILILELEAHENEEFQREMGDPVRGFPPDQLKAALAEAGLQPEIERRLEIGPESGAEKKAPDLYLVRARKPQHHRDNRSIHLKYGTPDWRAQQ